MAAFNVTVTNRSLVKASDLSRKPYVLPVSNLDLISGRSQGMVMNVYTKPPNADLNDVATVIRSHLPDFLNYFFPLAGRISANPATGRLEVQCNNAGAELVQARANVPLSCIQFHESGRAGKVIMQPYESEIPLSLQLVGFTCGGFALGWCSNHLLVDGYSLAHVLSCWTELVLTKKITKPVNFDHSIFQPRSPLRFSSSVEQNFSTCTADGLINVLSSRVLQRRLYYIAASDVEHLRTLASSNDRKATRTEALSAHMWKVLAEVVGESDTTCRMGLLINGRDRLGPAYAAAMDGYMGNVHTVAAKEARVTDLRNGKLSDVVKMVANSIEGVANEDHFLDMVDLVEHYGAKEYMVHRVQLGLGSPAIMISSCHRFPFEVEFGFGKAALSVFHTSELGRLGTGFMILAPSPKGDGSWLVNAVLWPQLAAALQADTICAFRPVTSEYLGMAGPENYDPAIVSKL